MSVRDNILLRQSISLIDHLKSPDTVEDISVLKYPKQFVVRCNLVEVCSLFICEEQVGFPNGVQHGRVQVQRVVWILLIGQPRVVPLLSQENIEPVVLQVNS